MLKEKEIQRETEIIDCYFCHGSIVAGVPYFEDERSGNVACLACAESINQVTRH